VTRLVGAATRRLLKHGPAARTLWAWSQHRRWRRRARARLAKRLAWLSDSSGTGRVRACWRAVPVAAPPQRARVLTGKSRPVGALTGAEGAGGTGRRPHCVRPARNFDPRPRGKQPLPAGGGCPLLRPR